MIKYVKLDKDNNITAIFGGTDLSWAISQGFTEQEVEQSDKDGRWYLKGFAPMKTDEEKAAEEAERIAMLNLTAADVERAIYKAKGIDFEDVLKLVEASQPSPLAGEGAGTAGEGLDIKALKIELKANNFYRGSEWVITVGAMLGFTPKQLDLFFEDGNYEHLISSTEN